MAETEPEIERSVTALELAETFQLTLPKETPSFIREMLPSHISSGYWLGLSSVFCNTHIPECNKELTMKMKLIENESRSETESMLLSRKDARKHGLRGGWKSFCKEHKLKEKDVLLFQLLQNSNTFQIYIFKRSDDVEPAKNTDHVTVMEKVVDGDPKLSIPAKKKHVNQKPDHFMDTEMPMEINLDHIPLLEKVVDISDPILSKPVKKKPGNVMHIDNPEDTYDDDKSETVIEYAVQCGKCYKWRLLEALEQLEEIRSEMVQNPFICNKKRNVSCEDPSDRVLDDPSRTWIIDKPGLPVTPSGFIRTVELSSDSSRCSIVYKVQNGKKKIRSFSEMKKFLEDHTEYNE